MKQQIIDQLQSLVREEISEEVFIKAEELGKDYLNISNEQHHQALDRFISEGGNAKDFEAPKDPLDSKFSELINILSDRGKKFKKERKEDTVEKLAAKQQIADELEKLIAEETNIGKAFHQFRELQTRWNDIGNVATSKYKNIQAAYQRHVHNFYYNMKLSKDLKELDFKRNYEHRMALLKKMESLLQMDSIKGAERMLKLYRIEWSELGPTAHETVEPLRTRYRELIAQVLQYIRDHYQKKLEEEQKHLEQKKALLERIQNIVADAGGESEKAESEKVSGGESENANGSQPRTFSPAHSHTFSPSISPKQWQVMTDAVERALNEWKQIGYAPKDESDKVWHDLRKALNNFYARKREYFAGLKKTYKSNKERKMALIEQTEAMVNQNYEMWDEPTQKILDLQKQWKNAGHLDYAEDNRLWKKFRDVCDRFFENKKAFFHEREAEQVGHLEKKEELIKKIEAYALTGNAEQDLKALREFTVEWKTIPHVPFKDKQRVYEKYKKAVDSKYDQMKLDSGQMYLLKFKNNIEMLAQSEQAERLLTKEKNNIRDRIHKLQGTITQYENNMGFFSNSKGVGGLMQEAEQNLNHAKEEVALLQKKLKMISEAMQQA